MSEIGYLGHNGMSRDQFVQAVLQSGQLTKISQHLVLVLFHLADTTTNVAEVSLSDLERITGWAKSTILDRLSEIDVFVKTTLGKGRRKTQFELQGLIAEAVEELRSVRVANSTELRVREANSMEPRVREANSTSDRVRVANSTASVRVANSTGPSVRQTNSTANSTELRVREANSTANSAKESFPPYPPSKKIYTLASQKDSGGLPLEGGSVKKGVERNGHGFIVTYADNCAITFPYSLIKIAARQLGKKPEDLFEVAETVCEEWRAKNFRGGRDKNTHFINDLVKLATTVEQAIRQRREAQQQYDDFYGPPTPEWAKHEFDTPAKWE